MVFEDWFTKSAIINRLSDVDHLFITLDTNSEILLLVSNFPDGILMMGKKYDLEEFAVTLCKRFPISKSVIDDTFSFNGFLIMQDINGDVTMSMT